MKKSSKRRDPSDSTEVYNTYCSAEDRQTGLHSNWSSIAETFQSSRTGGCFNCGNLVPPDVYLLPGIDWR